MLAISSSIGWITCRTSSEGAAPGCETTMLTSGRSIFGIAVTASLLKL